MPSTGQPDAAVRGTQNSPLPPSVETAYYRKCIELKRRVNEIEESNDAARVRKIRVNRQILKMRLERAFLLENLQKRMDANFDDSDRSTSPPPTPQEKPLRSKRGHRKTTPPPPGASVTNLETPGSTMAASGPPGQSYFDAAPDAQASLPPPRLTPGQSQPSASPYPTLQPQPAQSSPSAAPSAAFANGQTYGAGSGEQQPGARYDTAEEDPRNEPLPDRDGEARANGQTAPSVSADDQAAGNAVAAQDTAPTEGGAGGGFTALNR